VSAPRRGPLARLARFSVARLRAVLAVAALLLVAAVVLAAGWLELKTSNLDLVDPALPPIAAFRAFARDFGTPNVLVVGLEGGDPAALRAAVDALEPELSRLPGVRAVHGRLPYDFADFAYPGFEPYFAARDRGLFFLFVQPADPDSSAATLAPFVADVEAELARAGLAGRGIRASLTGLPKYAVDDRDVIQRDVSRITAVSFALIFGLFAASFASVRRPLMAMATLAVAVAVLQGLVAVWPGHLTLLSAFAGSFLFGLGIDYGIHVIDRVEEHLANGAALARAIVDSVAALDAGLLTGAGTTVAAFLALTLSGFRGFAELGAISAAGIVLCLLAMVTLLPALLVTLPARRRREKRLLDRRVGRLLAALHGRPLAAALVLGALALATLGLPTFDQDYLDLQPAGSEAVRLERAMVERSDFSPQFAAFVAPSVAAAGELAARLAREETVGAVRSAAALDQLAALGARPLPGAAGFRGQLVAADGRAAVFAYPKGDLWDPARRDDFLARMRAVAPTVTGMPVVGAFMIELSLDAFRVGVALAALAVVAIVAWDFRDPLRTAIALLPTGLTVLALPGLMRLAGLAFNPLDVMALPVVIGAAVDNGLQLVHRFLAERGDLRRALAGTGRSLALAAVTSIAGFGLVAFSEHRGLASFALLLTLGLASVLVFSLLVLPTVLELAAPRLLRERAAAGTAVNPRRAA
jgi:predicted RND superfamily exporter protein